MVSKSTEQPAVRAVIFDWAGTLVDFGSTAPTSAMVELFRQHHVTVTEEDVRGPMGLGKREHILAISKLPGVKRSWEAAVGRPIELVDVDRLYEELRPRLVAAAERRSNIIPGVLDTIAELRARGVRIGSTTGYSRDVMVPVVRRSFEQGLDLDSVVCADEVAQGRPTPIAIYKSLIELAVWPTHRVIKIDDTVPGLLEGKNAGCWTVGVATTGNAIGRTIEQWQSLSAGERSAIRSRAHADLREAGPDFVIDGVADLLPIVDQIEELIASGVLPNASRPDQTSGHSQ